MRKVQITCLVEGEQITLSGHLDYARGRQVTVEPIVMTKKGQTHTFKNEDDFRPYKLGVNGLIQLQKLSMKVLEDKPAAAPKQPDEGAKFKADADAKAKAEKEFAANKAKADKEAAALKAKADKEAKAAAKAAQIPPKQAPKAPEANA